MIVSYTVRALFLVGTCGPRAVLACGVGMAAGDSPTWLGEEPGACLQWPSGQSLGSRVCPSSSLSAPAACQRCYQPFATRGCSSPVLTVPRPAPLSPARQPPWDPSPGCSARGGSGSLASFLLRLALGSLYPRGVSSPHFKKELHLEPRSGQTGS